MVVENVTVVDVAAGTLRPHLSAVIEGERIVAVGPQGSLKLPLNARVVDGTGRYLSPGLWDMRVQLRNPDRQLPAFLAFGVTGIRDPGGDYDQAAETRLEIQKGKAIGPRIVASGPAVGGNQTAQTARLAFDRLFGDSVDFIQILPDLSREAYLALAEQARHWRLRFDGAVPADVSPIEAVNARQGIIEGLSNLGPLTEDSGGQVLRELRHDGDAYLTPSQPASLPLSCISSPRSPSATKWNCWRGREAPMRIPPRAEICRTN